jgi:outer membrane protein TolC
MPHIPPIVGLGLALCLGASAQTPPAPLTLTLEDALARARANSPLLLSANIAAQLAREDTVQAKAGLLPTLNWENQMIYTQPNGADHGVFVSADGTHVYNNQAVVHADIYAPGRRADYHRTIAAEAVARAKAEIAGRGLAATVVQYYYGMVVAARRYANAQRSLREAEQFADITQKQEQGGEAAHSDVVKAQLTLDQRRRDVQDAQLAQDKARIGFAVLLFPNFRQDFTVVDDLEAASPLPGFSEIQGLAQKNNPDIRAAQATVTQETYGIKSAKSARLPSLSFDYLYGLNANQYALHNEFQQKNLGSSVQATLNIPIWTWGAARSRVRQAELKLQQARTDLSFTQRQLLASLNAFYAEANSARSQLGSLRHSLDLSDESLRLTVLRYQAGEISVLEVVDAQTTLFQARNAYDDSLARYRLALANLQTLTGAF